MAKIKACLSGGAEAIGGRYCETAIKLRITGKRFVFPTENGLHLTPVQVSDGFFVQGKCFGYFFWFHNAYIPPFLYLHCNYSRLILIIQMEAYCYENKR